MLFSKLGQSSKRYKLRNIFETVLIILIARLSLFVYIEYQLSYLNCSNTGKYYIYKWS